MFSLNLASLMPSLQVLDDVNIASEQHNVAFQPTFVNRQDTLVHTGFDL